MKYLSGFGNHFETEALEGALPKGQNSPQQAPKGLYAEQLSGSAFTMARHENLRSWLYRIRPSVVMNAPFKPAYAKSLIRSTPFNETPVTPNVYRWNPLPALKHKTDFIQGLVTLVGNGDAASQTGCAAHVYACNTPMDRKYFYNTDGEMLFMPVEGVLELKTELGTLQVEPLEIAVIPRGVKFQVNPKDSAMGYLGENFGHPLVLPNLGPIGSNGLANAHDFQSPVASFEDFEGPCELVVKCGTHLWSTNLSHSPLDVVAWRGNYAPYKYDLRKFNTIGTVSFDHPDPSIFTVLTSPSATAGMANLDFVIFPPRWMVAENTFRPPYFHRNIMSEFMGLIKGQYDGKADGFVPGGASLHNCMSGHGPDTSTYEAATKAKLSPHKIEDTMIFMLESRYPFALTQYAASEALLQPDYFKCWQSLTKKFR